ncbi:restriction endonuclease subunit S [Streptococcaceae bacterium ESL0729]|nr:restriction endonuclease subunit S [Streptococcaceae bacterium ESL0729]
MKTEPLETHSLKDLATIIDNRGKTPPLCPYSSFPLIDVRTLSGDTRIIDYKNAQKFIDEETFNNWFRSGHPHRYDTLISTVGSIGLLKMFLEEKGTIAQNIVALRPKYGNGIFLYQLLKNLQKKIQAYDIGSVQPSIKVTQFMRETVEIPIIEYVTSWENEVEALVLQIENNSKEIGFLEDLRDTLLPKLISGRIF